nr:polyprotein [Iflaviridae sp.]
MAYVVAFNKESEKAVIYEMDHEDRMNAIVVDGMPTLQDLDNFYEQKRINDLIHSRRGREVNLAFESLIDMASNAGPVEHRDNRLRDLKLYRVLSTIIELYVYRRTGCESVSLRRDICRISNEKKSWAWELMYRSIKYSGIRAIATWIHAMNDEVGLELNTLSHSEIFQPDVYPESAESTVIGEEVINVEKASNVTLTTARESSITQTSAPSIKWSKFVSNDVVDDYATITDRWYTLGSFTWDNTQRQSQIIYRIGDRTPILPLDIVYNGMEVPCDMPNLIPFKVHTYWRGDIEIKIQVNSNKFQIGQLMAAFYYQSDLNENIYDKMNIFSMSQMDHVVIQASASNEATLYVPYASMYPMLPTRKVPTADSSASILNLGTLWIMVQNQLSSTATGPKKCKGSVLIRFVNSEFTGLSHGSFAVKPEAGLLQPIVKSAMNVVQQVAADFNRDNPPDIAPPKYLVPTASHSWSTGTNDVDPIHMLRLDPTGQTYHNLDKQVNNETSIANVVSKFGLVDIIPWMSEKSNKGKRGDVLYKLPAAPDIMNQREGGGETASYVLSPVGIVASLFHQWRGTLEFKIQIVASQFHTGRIMVGYIPGYTGDTPTINQLKASPHAIFDLQEQREFSYEVPYISYKPWWTRQQTGNYPIAASPAPSTFCILIYNELIVMETVPDFVFINIYIRAGRSFEVSIPVQPSISLSWHKDFVYPAEDKTGAIDGYSPYYYGWWVGLNNSKTLCGRWGTLSEEIAEMRELQRNLMPRQYMYYQLDPSVVKRNYPDAVFKHDNMRTIPSYAIIHQSGHGFAIIVPFIEEVSCQTVAKAIYIDKKSLSDPDLQRHCMTSDYFLPGNYSTGNPSWVVLIRTEATQRRVPRADVEWVEHESDEQSTVVDLALMDTLASTNNGKLFYGESFVDLKDLGRRYQMDSDFRPEEGRTPSSTLNNISNEIRKLADPRVLTKAAIGSIPLVGPALAGAPVIVSVEKLADQATSTMAKMENTLGNIATAADGLHEVTNQLTPIITAINSFMDSVRVPDVGMWSERLIDFIMDLSLAWYQKSWVTVGISCVKMIAKILVVNIANITSQLNAFVEAVVSMVRVNVQAPSTTATLIGALAGIVGVAIGAKINQERYSSYSSAFGQAFLQTSGISYLNQVIRFVQTTFDVMRDMVMEALGYASPEAVALKMLSGKDLILKNFIVSAQSIMNEANASMMLHPGYRVRFWYTVTQAYQIQQVLAMVPANVVSPQLSKLCSEIIRLGNENMVNLGCSPVRYEPFVVCIEGKEGIGKSHLTDKLVEQLLLSIGYTKCSAGYVYTRAPGSKHWNGYMNQPAIVYDDFANLNNPELMSQQISELYQIKSTATFIPEMAHLEAKNIKANPILVILLTNGAFPSSMANVANHPRAVYRRRDVVLKAEMRPEFDGQSPRDLPTDVSVDVGHVQFTKFSDPCDQASCSVNPKSWSETINWLASTFKRYHAQEEVNVRCRIDRLRGQLQIDAAECFDFEDPFALLYRTTEFISQEEQGTNAWLPSEKLEAAVTSIVEQVKAKKLQRIPIIVPPPPDDIFTQFDCCPASWRELAKYFVRGAIMTPTLWRSVLNWTAEGLQKAIDFTKTITSKPIQGECCVCMEETELAYGCVDSENMHKVCAPCWMNVRTLSPTICCPVCRSRQMGVLLEPADGMLATILVWLSTFTGNYLIPALQSIARLFGRLHSRALGKIQLISDLILGLVMEHGMDTRGIAASVGRVITAEILEPEETWHDAFSDVLQTADHMPLQSMLQAIIPPVRHLAHNGVHQAQGHLTYEQRSPLSPDMVHFDLQADDEWDIPPPRDLRLSHRDDPLSRCELNEDGFQASRNPKICRLPQCYHQALTDNIDTIIYRDSQIIGPAWQLPMEIGGQLQNIMVLDFPCQHNCVWEIESVHRDFCTQYIARNQARIARVQIQYVGALQTNPIEFLKTIPRFARPTWAVENNTIPPDMTSENWWTYLSEPWERYKNILKITTMVAGAMGAVYLTYTQLSSWFGSSAPAVAHWPIPQGDPNYNPEHTRFIQRAARDIRAVRTPRQIHSQGDNLGDVVESYVCNNYIRIVIDSEQKQRYLTAMGIFGHYAILPRHYVKLLSEEHKAGKKIYIAAAKMEWAGSQSTRHLYNFDERDFRVSPITDIAIFKLPASFRMFKDIRKFLCLQKDLSQNYINSEGKIILSPTRDNQIPQVIPIVLKDFQQSEVFNDADGTQFEAFNVLHYAYSKLGACGSVVCVENSQRPIVAMHCAGQGEGIYGEGYGVLLTQECFEGMFEENISVQCEEVESGSIESAQFIFDEACQVTYLGTVPPNLQPHIPQKTKIEKSLLHNQYGFQAKTEPTILSPRDPRHVHNFSPLYYGARKHGLKTYDFTTTQIERAGEALWDRWLAKLQPAVVDPQRLTPEQAVLGFEGNKYYEALSMNTSAGYPWNLSGNTSKENWITVDWNTRSCVIDPKLRGEIERKEKLRCSGIVPRTVFVDTLKDERKLPHKVRKAGGTRVFCASPVDYTIALRQNLLHFCAAYMKDRHQQMHGVGIDVHGTEWSRLWTRLTKHGLNNFVGLDYSNFGPGFNARVSRKASQLMNRWTLKHVRGVSPLELDALGWECDHSVHLCGNTLYQQEAGSPSGASITVIKNSLVNLLYVLCAWDALCAEHARTVNIDIWAEFEENVELCVYGDDLIMTVSNFYEEKFNMQTIQEWFAQYGIVSTDATKSGGKVSPFVGSKEITFLKRGWRKHPTRWLQYLAPLDIISINDITQWIWRSPDRRQATRVNCESALLEAHGSGPEVYEALRRKINEALVRIHVSPITMSWEDVDNKYYDSDTLSGSVEVWG